MKKKKSGSTLPIDLIIPSDARYLRVLRSVLESAGHLFEMDEKDIQSIQLATNEACANIIKHSYCEEPNHNIIVRIFVEEGNCRIELEDEGMPLQPEKIHSRPLDEIKPGGLGVHLIQSLMDEVIFDTNQDNKNRLILIKELTCSNERDD